MLTDEVRELVREFIIDTQHQRLIDSDRVQNLLLDIQQGLTRIDASLVSAE